MKFQSKIIILQIAAFLIIYSMPSMAELSAYMQVNGATQGDIQGDVTQAGLEDTFEIYEYHHLIKSGTPTQHEPLIVTTPMSKSIPLLMRALDTDEPLSVIIRFYRASRSGAEEQYYTIELSNAKLAAIEPISYNNRIPENMQLKASTRLRFTYSTITETYEIEKQVVEMSTR